MKRKVKVTRELVAEFIVDADNEADIEDTAKEAFFFEECDIKKGDIFIFVGSEPSEDEQKRMEQFRFSEYFTE